MAVYNTIAIMILLPNMKIYIYILDPYKRLIIIMV